MTLTGTCRRRFTRGRFPKADDIFPYASGCAAGQNQRVKIDDGCKKGAEVVGGSGMFEFMA